MSSGFFDFHAKVVRGQRGRSTPEPPAVPAGAASANGVPAGPNGQAPQAMSVSELAAKVAGVIRTGFPGPVWVKGEVSGYRGPAASGHHYFRLKDERACIDCVVWAGESARIKFKWADGMEVLACGSVATFAGKSTYQLKVSDLLPVGQGALELAFRQLKDRLEREGLFDPERKRPIPPYPRRIALVTSRGAAGLADMLKVLRRYSWLKLMLYHVPVQGDAAHPAIAAALTAINRHAAKLGGVEVILLGRGGGSMEDLWAFNEEVVARAVADSKIPVVTGIGHEVDVSIADLAADHHAHTPTEAAQVVTQHWRLAADFVTYAGDRLTSQTVRLVEAARSELASIRRHEAFRRPADLIVRTRQQALDDLHKSLQLARQRRFDALRRRLDSLDCRLQVHRPTAMLAAFRERVDCLDRRMAERHPRHAVARLGDRLTTIRARLHAAARAGVAGRLTRLDALTRELDVVGPLQVLRRGYSITMRQRDRQIIKSVKEIKPGDRMLTRFADGEHEWTAGDGQMPLFS